MNKILNIFDTVDFFLDSAINLSVIFDGVLVGIIVLITHEE